MDFKTLLVDLRKKSKVSIYQLSKLSGVPKSTIFNYEQGVSPTIDKAHKLLKALGTGVELGERNADKVIRCRDCKERHQYDAFDKSTEEFYKCFECRVFKRDLGDDGFCSYGERRKTDEDN